ncbi:MAG TPA: 3-hydroxyacyl-CoA dehydrogenase family protein [Baekduia sp.]|uniref:3-hydroxyacyl-CoA dehydrogenase family protein n=1 Tax=Baekduia sp. TaxID=2600305 RepID=UPI002D78083F|nr:3-hydroxyacyl-CoA dehydrogenase family protein [Baekduia sp.]HET6505376.1 3-hydroxyacyl-CoA dehydrogenase family protein [Baekduia sp.]
MSERQVVVIGAGTMGRGIAMVAVASGISTVLMDVDRRALERAREQVERHAPEAARALTTTTVLEQAVGTASLVVEAVPELPALKREIFAHLERSAPADAVLATNTSTIPIAEIARACERPERVVGLHFFNPVHRMAVVEVISGERTRASATERANAFAVALGKDPINVRDSPGFVANRLGLLLGNEAMRIVEEGIATPADVDKAARLGFGHPMGPLQVADLVGLDARLNNLRSMHALTGRAELRPPTILEELVGEGRLGRKSGRGFYDYG